MSINKQPASIMTVLLFLGLAGLPVLGRAAAHQQHDEPKAICGHDLDITHSTTLNPQCRYTGTTFVTGQHSVLDCRGAVLDAQGKRAGLSIGGKAPSEGIEVKNCIITGAKGQGLFVGRNIPDSERPRHPDGSIDRTDYPNNIKINNVSVIHNKNVGIYIDSYVKNTIIEKSEITYNSGPGIYLEHDSTGTEIKESNISHNGFKKGGHGASREGIAVDASSHNAIMDNRLNDNAAGGVFVYRNCGEQPDNPHQSLRKMPAAHNLIMNNTISGSPYGVWVASRQERHITADKCRLKIDPEHGVFADDAPHNKVRANTIVNVTTGIRLSDSNNLAADNKVKAKRYCLYLGSASRSHLKHPVDHLSVTHNQCLAGKIKRITGTGQ